MWSSGEEKSVKGRTIARVERETVTYHSNAKREIRVHEVAVKVREGTLQHMKQGHQD
jgi:hypothetical protein